MNEKYKFIVVTAIALCSIYAVANSTVTATNSSSTGQITLQYEMQNQDFQLSQLNVNGKEYTYITLNDAAKDRANGEPDLPKIAQAVIIPDKGKMLLEVTEVKYTEQKVNVIIPSKGRINRNTNPADVPYTFGAAYSQNAWFPNQCAYLGVPYIAGEYRGSVIYFEPFQYNPVIQTLRIYSIIVVKITPTTEPGKNEKSRTGRINISPEFDEIYSRSFANYHNTHHQVTTEDGSMLIISHKDFLQTVQPLVDWKNKRGVKTELVDVATIGTTAASIKTYIDNYYKDKTKNLKYLLLVGDIQKVSNMVNYPVYDTGFTEDAVADNMYGMIEGNDAYMEIFVGRLDGSTTAQIQSQVNKILYTERNLTVNDTWLNNAGFSYSAKEDDDKTANNYELNALKSYGYTTTQYTDSNLIKSINNGIGVHFNNSHGDISQFPDILTTSDISELTNVGKYPFGFSSACLAGDNDTLVDGECLAQALLRKDRGGYVAVQYATVELLWAEPYSATKECANILCEKYPTNIKRTFGGLAINGCFKMLADFPESGPEELRCWPIFGDPNLHIYTKTPQTLTITHPASVDTGKQDITITGTDKATVCLYNKAMGLQTVRDLSSGTATFPVTITGKDDDTVYVTGTMFNCSTYEGFMIVNTKTKTTSISSSKSDAIETFAANFTGSQFNYQIPGSFGLNTMNVIIQLYTPLGKLVSNITDGKKGPGRYSVALKGNGCQLASGTYLSLVKIGSFKMVMPIVLK